MTRDEEEKRQFDPDGDDEMVNKEDDNIYDEEDTLVRTLSISGADNVLYTSAQQTADWGADRTTPFMIELYQMSAAVGRGWKARATISKDGVGLTGIEDFDGETVGTTLPSNITERWDSVGGTDWEIVDSAGDSQPLRGNRYLKNTGVSNEAHAVSFDDAGLSHDTEVLCVMRNFAAALDSSYPAGVVLRGGQVVDSNGVATFKGLLLTCDGGNRLKVQLRDGYTTTGTTLALFDVDNDTEVSLGDRDEEWQGIRFRVENCWVYAKIWNYYWEPEPVDWQIVTYFENATGILERGWTGVYSDDNSRDFELDFFAWAHNGRRAG